MECISLLNMYIHYVLRRAYNTYLAKRWLSVFIAVREDLFEKFEFLFRNIHHHTDNKPTSHLYLMSGSMYHHRIFKY